MPRRILTFVIGHNSRKIGKPCHKCEKLLEDGDEITTRGIKQLKGIGTVKNYHSECWNKLFID